MKYIVTGGCGFIGSNLSKTLSKNGNDVTVIDNLSTGSLNNVKGFNFGILNDISDIWSLKGFDGIFHLGIPSSTPLYRNDRTLIGKAVSEFITVLEYAKQNNLKVVWASSSSVYNGQEPPFMEDMQILPMDFYTEARIAMERIAKVYHDFYSVRSVGLRLFSVYGPGEESKGKFANMVSQIIWAKNKDETFDIYNNGEALRDFVHVSDVVEAFRLSMKSGLSYEILNVGMGKAYSINDVIKASGFRKFRYVENPLKNYVDRTLADTSKAESVLGFRAKIDVMRYIKEVCA